MFPRLFMLFASTLLFSFSAPAQWTKTVSPVRGTNGFAMYCREARDVGHRGFTLSAPVLNDLGNGKVSLSVQASSAVCRQAFGNPWTDYSYRVLDNKQPGRHWLTVSVGVSRLRVTAFNDQGGFRVLAKQPISTQAPYSSQLIVNVGKLLTPAQKNKIAHNQAALLRVWLLMGGVYHYTESDGVDIGSTLQASARVMVALHVMKVDGKLSVAQIAFSY